MTRAQKFGACSTSSSMSAPPRRDDECDMSWSRGPSWITHHHHHHHHESTSPKTDSRTCFCVYTAAVGVAFASLWAGALKTIDMSDDVRRLVITVRAPRVVASSIRRRFPFRL